MSMKCNEQKEMSKEDEAFAKGRLRGLMEAEAVAWGRGERDCAAAISAVWGGAKKIYKGSNYETQDTIQG